MTSPRLTVPALAACAVLMAGCAVGPEFARPEAPTAAAYSPDGLPAPTAQTDLPTGAAQKFNPGAPVAQAWWEAFHAEPLTRLVEQALKTNPDVQAAEAALRQARELAAAGTSAFLPTIDGQAGVTRQQASGQSVNGANTKPFTLYNASVNVSYNLDLFGGARRAYEGLEAQADVMRFELEAARLTLAANVVTTALQEASLRAQIAATRDIIDADKQQLQLLEQQLELGAIARTAVLAQAATLAQAEATLPLLDKQLAQTRHQLAALVGQLPSDELGATFELAQMQLPENLPLTLPSRLVARRPDVRAAEAQLRAASAAVGVATANMLPQISLSAGYGAEALALGDLLSPGAAVWGLGAGLLQPLFHGGELRHKRNAAEAAYDEAAARYRGAVLTAFQNVADALQALRSDAEALRTQWAADRAAFDSLELAREQLKAGSVSYLSVLTAQQTWQQTKIALAQAEARRFADTAALFQALGGGWTDEDTSTNEEKTK